MSFLQMTDFFIDKTCAKKKVHVWKPTFFSANENSGPWKKVGSSVYILGHLISAFETMIILLHAAEQFCVYIPFHYAEYKR
jgi:hypothetical protein